LAGGVIDRKTFDALVAQAHGGRPSIRPFAPRHRGCNCRRTTRRSCTQLPPAFHVVLPG
jgi:hypothetical protein